MKHIGKRSISRARLTILNTFMMANIGFGSKHVRFRSPIYHNDQETDSSDSEKESVSSVNVTNVETKSVEVQSDKSEDAGGFKIKTFNI